MQMLELSDQQSASNYISKNLIVGRNVNPTIFAQKVVDETIVLNEKRILLVKQGTASPIINLVPRSLKAGDVVFLASNSLVRFEQFSDDVHGAGLSMSDDLFDMALGSTMPAAFDGHLRDFVLHLDAKQFNHLDDMHHLLYNQVALSGDSLQVTLHLIGAFIHQVAHYWQASEAYEHQVQSREQQLFANFMQLVAQHAPTEHNITFYASKLCLSPRYMSTIIKRVSGKPAKQWIDDAIVARIRVALRHTDKQLTQISDEMNFTNTSFFSKYFKRLTGMTPLEYRNG